MTTSIRPAQFPGSFGTPLAARLELPAVPPVAYALFAHCFTCSKNSVAAARISTALVEQGFGVLRFDFTGLGDSKGDFANTNFSSNVADLVAAADWLRAHHGPPRVLIGHSLGGAAVLAAAREIADARAVATMGAPFHPAHVQQLLGDVNPEIEARGEAVITLQGRSFRVRRQFLEDLAKQDNAEHIGRLRKALLIFHSPRDTVVDIDNAARIFAAAKHPKSFVSLDTADHLLTDKGDAQYVAAVLAAWASRYVGQGRDAVAPISHGGVIVRETGEGPYTQSIVAGPHRLRADEPAALGGNDSGFTPYELLLSGLGACTSMTLRMYAEKKKWPLQRVTVELRHRKIDAADCPDCRTREGKVDRIERTIALEGELDGVQRARLLEIANRCPVHRTLHSEIVVRTSLSDR
ncbi:MAG: OsmC family protein [Burkholderiales bacterium]|nr:OsmC family protein [Burkholderiales bacterium]